MPPTTRSMSSSRRASEKKETETAPVEWGSPESEFGHIAPCRGIRFWGYLLCSIGLAGWVLVGIPLVAYKYLPPHPTDDYAGLTGFICLWMPVFALINNRGEKRTWAQRWEEFIFVWLIVSGLAQVFWELPFVLIKRKYLHPIESTSTLKDSELWLWVWWMYGSGDTRYMRPHSSSHATETMLAISGFFELAAAYWIKKGGCFKYKTGLVIAALTHWGFFWANTSVIYIAEIYDNYENISDGWAGYWVKWAGLNLQWSVLCPICTGAALWLLHNKAKEEGRSARSVKSE